MQTTTTTTNKTIKQNVAQLKNLLVFLNLIYVGWHVDPNSKMIDLYNNLQGLKVDLQELVDDLNLNEYFDDEVVYAEDFEEN